MTLRSWSARPATARGNPAARPRRRLNLECLEDRTVPTGYALGFAFALGAADIDQGWDVAVDPNNDVILTGRYSSPAIDVDPGAGEHLLPNAGSFDAFIAKYSPSGTFLWATRVASAGSDVVRDTTVDAAGNVLLGLRFSGTLEIGGPGRTPVTLTAGADPGGYLAKLDPAGNFVWAASLRTGSAIRTADGLTADAAGTIYVTGGVGAEDSAGSSTMYVASFTASGAEAWSRTIGPKEGDGYSYASGADVAVDASGNVLVTGSYRGTIDFNPDRRKSNNLTSVGAKQNNLFGDAFVLKLSGTGNYVWAGAMGGRDADYGRGVAVDGAGNVHVWGSFGADPQNDFDPGRGMLTLPGGGGFVVKLDANRNLLWGRSGVGTGDMALDGAGKVYTTGLFSGTFEADPGPGTFNLTAGGEYDVLISKLNSAGNFEWAGGLGGPGSGYDEGKSIAVDGTGNVYITGNFRGTADFDPGPGIYPLASTPDGSGNPGTDLFLTKLTTVATLQASSGAIPAASVGDNLTLAQVEHLVGEAVARWQAGGFDVSALGNLNVRIADLPGFTLGLASGDTIWLDLAAGWGWFVDPTPGDDSEFLLPGGQGEQGRMDLLAALMHEVGHLLGHDHDGAGVMGETLAAGQRPLLAGDAYWADLAAALHTIEDPADAPAGLHPGHLGRRRG